MSKAATRVLSVDDHVIFAEENIALIALLANVSGIAMGQRQEIHLDYETNSKAWYAVFRLCQETLEHIRVISEIPTAEVAGGVR